VYDLIFTVDDYFFDIVSVAAADFEGCPARRQPHLRDENRSLRADDFQPAAVGEREAAVELPTRPSSSQTRPFISTSTPNS